MDKILFRKFMGEDEDCNCCKACPNCDCDDCSEASDLEALETMTIEELLAYANEEFNVVLNKYKDANTLIEEIADLFNLRFQQEEVTKANLEQGEAPHLTESSGV